jgi:hypothetical protein
LKWRLLLSQKNSCVWLHQHLAACIEEEHTLGIPINSIRWLL